MKRLVLVFGFLGMAALGFSAATPFQDQGKNDPIAAAQEAMDKWLAFSTPGTEQQWLAKRSGTWNLVVTQFNMGDDSIQTNAVSTCQMILGDRYLYEYMNGMTDIGRFEGSGVFGYDNARKVFVSSWVDNMGTGISSGTGKRSADGKRIEWQVTTTDPMVGGDVLMRSVEEYVSNDRIEMSMYAPDPKGGEVKIMEIIYTRAKE